MPHPRLPAFTANSFTLPVLRSALVATALLLSGNAAAWTADLASVSSVPLKRVQAPLAKRIESALQTKSQAYAFAIGAPMNAGLEDGLWEPLGSEAWRWRLRVVSPGAVSLNFEFARFHLPPGAELRIYDIDGQLVQGPYTAADETPEGRLWTAVIEGAQAVIELNVPYADREAVDLELAQVNHGFRSFVGLDQESGSTAKAASSCSIDAICPAGDSARNAIRAVAKATINGQWACTGTLLNNQRQNGDPLFITASHCGIGTAGLPASSVVTYWNFLTPVCRILGGVLDISLPINLGIALSGSTLLASDELSDFTLLRLSRAPSTLANPYYAGWNARGDTPQGGFTVHHPGGAEKSISLFRGAASPRNYVMIGTLVVDAWEVLWSQGVTEYGSSGAGLFDQNQRVVGWLSGGSSSCAAPQGLDYFGRMNVAWNNKAAASSQLKAWLDPDNTGVNSLCGRDMGAAPCTAGILSDSGGVTNPGTGTDTGDSNGSNNGESGGGGGAFGSLLLLPGLLAAALRRMLTSRRASRA